MPIPAHLRGPRSSKRPVVLPWLAFLSLLVSGCAGDPWEAYDDTLYRALRDATKEAVQAHEDLLRRILDEADEAGTLPPPGVAAEYGYALAGRGEAEAGRHFLDLERKHYPESAAFVDALGRAATGEEVFRDDAD